MVYRIFVEKKPGLDNEAAALRSELTEMLGIRGITGVRLFIRYDAENISPELFDRAVGAVFSEPPLDNVARKLPVTGGCVFAVEYLPGQFDQRADSAAQCIQILSMGERPSVRTAKVYAISGDLSDADVAAIKKYVINPVDSREASPELPQTLEQRQVPPPPVAVLDGFRELGSEAIAGFVSEYGLAMDADDLEFCRRYFVSEGRDPTLTEIRMIDTYWSDHCRHTTFNTRIDRASISDPEVARAYDMYLATREELGRDKPVSLMDIGTLAARALKARGMLSGLDESEEINACTVRTTVTVDGRPEPWLLLFKNETHNHPTEIEPFGGAATCIGGAIRDPLSGRAYVYAAMRVTGAADPTAPVSSTLPGKLPQRQIVRTAAAGYSSYGNQIGLATGQVSEVYHPGYAAKRMEIGAVIAAAPARNVRRERPTEGDAVILLGGRTGRDGIGGATGSSKAHNKQSVSTCGAEVQKGNAPEERKLQRLFRDPEAARMIKKCNDFGAGGVSVAVGELADGLMIELDRVPKKYDGLDGTELAISESQERMAVVVDAADAGRFIELAASENLEATRIATVTSDGRLRMVWRGQTVVDISRDFLDTNGAAKHIEVEAAPCRDAGRPVPAGFREGYLALVSDLNVCSQRGLCERFDSTIGAGSVLMPFGGRLQRSPVQAMVNKISCERGHTDDCSFMAWGFDPELTEASPFHGAYLAVVESLCKLIATGASYSDVYLSFQEYFEKPGRDPRRWGKPFSALLGAFRAQMDYGIAAIGGKDSMSGSYEDLDVPPTLVSFAVTTGRTSEVVSPEFKSACSRVILVCPEYGGDGLPVPESLISNIALVTGLMRAGRVSSCRTAGYGGVAEAVYKMSIGNGFGFCFEPGIANGVLFGRSYGSFVLELSGDAGDIPCGIALGRVSLEKRFVRGGESVSLADLDRQYEGRLESVYPVLPAVSPHSYEAFSTAAGRRGAPSVRAARPAVLIPVFPGTNCEYDSARACLDAGAEPRIFVINNLSAESVARSVDGFASAIDAAQAVFIPGGFSGGDEPDGSAKFITSFFRSAPVAEAVNRLLVEREGLMLGICNGFQALIKLGLVPFGRICDADASFPTLTYNRIARHQSKLVRIRVASNISPWLSMTEPGQIFTVPVSHGEGRFLASPELVRGLAADGRVATQYVDGEGRPTDDIAFNPNGSAFAVEGITSPDGRVFGKMGHSERTGQGLYVNVPGIYDMKLFESAVKYFRQ